MFFGEKNFKISQTNFLKLNEKAFRDHSSEFVDKTKGMKKNQREEIYKQYLI